MCDNHNDDDDKNEKNCLWNEMHVKSLMQVQGYAIIYTDDKAGSSSLIFVTNHHQTNHKTQKCGNYVCKSCNVDVLKNKYFALYRNRVTLIVIYLQWNYFAQRVASVFRYIIIIITILMLSLTLKLL